MAEELPTNIISLSKKRIEYRGCKHLRIIVSEELDYVECRDCGEHLNPMRILYRFATEETRWMQNARDYKKSLDELNKRKRVKCRHCGQMTPVNIKAGI